MRARLVPSLLAPLLALLLCAIPGGWPSAQPVEAPPRAEGRPDPRPDPRADGREAPPPEPGDLARTARDVPVELACRTGEKPLTARDLVTRLVGEGRNRVVANREGLLSPNRDAKPSGTSIAVRLTVPPTEPPLSASQLRAAAWQPRDDPRDARFEAVRAERQVEAGTPDSDRELRLTVDLPPQDGIAFARSWTLVVVACDKTGEEIIAFGRIEHRIVSARWAWGISLILLVAAYVVVALAARRAHASRVARRRRAEGEAPAPVSLLRALDPVFVCQTSDGVGSLGRLQLLAFSFAVAFVYSYVLWRTNSLASISQDLLKLLGIAAASSGLARIAGYSGSVSTPNLAWLRAKGLLPDASLRLPSVQDLVCSDGEIEVARVQAALFSALTLIAIVINGPRNLAGMNIPDETLLLIGLSQAAFVAGKAVPSEAVRQANQLLDAVRGAERALRDATDRAAQAATVPEEAARLAVLRDARREDLRNALIAAEDTLVGIYGRGFDREAYAGLV